MSDLSNPEAPSGVTYDGGDATDVKSLSNADFRQFLMTPRTGATPSRFAYTDPNARAVPRTPRRGEKLGDGFKKPKPRAPRDGEEKAKKGESYRDRAAERREGDADEYAEGEEILRVLEQEEDRETVIEHSKFLGGDEEHTHLVKGLDYALYAKKQRQIEEEARKAQEENARLQRSGNLNLASKQIIATSQGIQTVEAVTDFKTDLGRSVHRAIFNRSRPSSIESFLPGRMSFVYDLDPDMNLDIPTVVVHPKDEVLEEKDMIWCFTHQDVITKVSIALADARDNKSHRRMKRKDRDEPRASPLPNPTEASKPLPKLEAKISLFDDVDDDYAPTISAPIKPPAPAKPTPAPQLEPKEESSKDASNDAMDVDTATLGPQKPSNLDSDDYGYGYPDYPDDSYQENPPKRPKTD